ncbi:MAG TPA: hypothetical protein VFD38_14880 [Myxococcaceae bacterium]|nr:hypothetical protein [Myxococcaceae bacterium]
MNTLPLHPAVVHVPLGLAVVMPLLLGAIVWAVVTRRLPAKVWLLPLLLQGVLLGAAVFALRTGEQDEDRVEARAGESAVDAHERAAQAFTAAAGATFLAAAAALALRRRRGPFLIAGAASVALSVAMLVLGIQTGSRGGALVHGGPEVAGGGAARPGGLEEGARERTSAEDDDDEDD